MSIKEKFNIAEMDELMNGDNLDETKAQFMDRFITIIIAAMGLIAALAWDEALKHLFKVIFKEEGTLAGDIGYAIVITLLATVISIYLRKLFIQKKLNK